MEKTESSHTGRLARRTVLCADAGTVYGLCRLVWFEPVYPADAAHASCVRVWPQMERI